MRLYDELNEIKKNGKNNKDGFERLQKICIDEESIYSALEIAKHESTLSAPVLAITIALFAVMLNFAYDRVSYIALTFLFLFSVIYIAKDVKKWTYIYYYLIEIKRDEHIKNGEKSSDIDEDTY